MLVTSKLMLTDARRKGYAVPAINTQGGNFDIIRAICLAAEQEKSPVILAHYISTGAYAGDDWFFEVAKWWANKVSVPVAVHLDHGDSVGTCLRCLELGFTSLMYDGSALPIVENARNTNEVIKYASKKGVTVEAEVGQLARLDSEGNVIEAVTNTIEPKDVYQFLDLCSPDSLAIGIGNAHGYYKTTPRIRVDIMEEVAKHTDIPLVLHGCTGMDEDVIRKCISLGISKINFGTQIRYDYVEHLDNAIHTMDHQGHSFKIMHKASDDLIQDVKKIIQLSGSHGRA